MATPHRPGRTTCTNRTPECSGSTECTQCARHPVHDSFHEQQAASGPHITLSDGVPVTHSERRTVPHGRARRTRRLGRQATIQNAPTARSERIKAIARRYAAAIEQGDPDMLVSMLTQDATWSMPPYCTWFRGRAAIRQFLVRYPLARRWKHRPTRANGQLAVSGYLYDPAEDSHVPSRHRRANAPGRADRRGHRLPDCPSARATVFHSRGCRRANVRPFQTARQRVVRPSGDLSLCTCPMPHSEAVAFMRIQAPGAAGAVHLAARDPARR